MSKGLPLFNGVSGLASTNAENENRPLVSMRVSNWSQWGPVYGLCGPDFGITRGCDIELGSCSERPCLCGCVFYIACLCGFELGSCLMGSFKETSSWTPLTSDPVETPQTGWLPEATPPPFRWSPRQRPRLRPYTRPHTRPDTRPHTRPDTKLGVNT
jgi:hypothetical protein